MQFEQPPVPMIGVTTAKEFRKELHEIKYQYHHLAMMYDSINFKGRRSVTRKYTTERFYCAAILQFHSDMNELNQNNWQTLGKTSVRKHELAVDEECPVARKWYTSLFEAERLLQEFVRAGHPVDQLYAIRTVVQHARQSLQTAQDWLRLIIQVESETEDHSVQAVTESWNIMATDVRDANLKPAVAAQNGDVYMASRPKMPMENFNVPTGKRRYWFDYEMEYPR